MTTSAEFQGDKLRERREEMGLSLYEAARRTHISIRNLQAIEEANFAILPGECYSIGFIKTYCELLTLDPAPFIDSLRACMRPQSARFLRRQQGSPKLEFSRPQWFNDLLTWAVVLGMVVLGWVTYSTIVGTHTDAAKQRVEASSNEIILPPTPTESDF